MRMMMLRNLCVMLAVFWQGACGAAPAEMCVQGTYLLNLDNSVRLQLAFDRFTLSVGSDQTTGTYRYYKERSEVGFHPESGKISAASRSAAYAKAGLELGLGAFFDSMEAGHEPYAYPIAQTWRDSIIIDVHPDGLRLIKEGCSSSAS